MKNNNIKVSKKAILVNLTEVECKNITGGESGWYWVLYAVGSAIHGYQQSLAKAYSHGGSHYHSAG